MRGFFLGWFLVFLMVIFRFIFVLSHVRFFFFGSWLLLICLYWVWSFKFTIMIDPHHALGQVFFVVTSTTPHIMNHNTDLSYSTACNHMYVYTESSLNRTIQQCIADQGILKRLIWDGSRPLVLSFCFIYTLDGVY